MFRKFLNSYFGFNKQQRNGLYILCCISFCLLIIRISYPYFIKQDPIQFENLAMIEEEIDEKRDSARLKNSEYQFKGTLFPFDPNTISQEELIKLGFKEKTAQTFIKFRNRGFQFKQKEDLKKIYGVSEKMYARLENYILIKGNYSNAKKEVTIKETTSTKKLELNSADSLSLIELKGIGPGYAKRILKYRGLLGGFISMNQLKEIYGMTDELYALIASQCRVDPRSITKIKINTVDFKTLNKHPYINYELTKHIFNFKKTTPIIEENIDLVIEDDELAAKIKPYLEY